MTSMGADGNLVVHPLRRRFLPYVAKWLNEPDIAALMNVDKKITTSCLLKTWKTARDSLEIRTFIFVYNGSPIGQGFLFNFHENSCEIGWFLSSRYRSRGLGFLSHKHLLTYASQLPNISSVRAVVRQQNVPSMRVVQRLGYKEVYECDRGVMYSLSSAPVARCV